MNYRKRLKKLEKSHRESLEKAAVKESITNDTLPPVAQEFQQSKHKMRHVATHKIGDKYHHVMQNDVWRYGNQQQKVTDPQDYHFLSTSPNPMEHGHFLAEINTLPHNPQDMDHRETKHFANWHDPAQITYSKARQQGQGHGQMLYNSVLAHHGLLMSDEQISPGAQKQWENNYPKQPGVNTDITPNDSDRHVVAVKDKKAFHDHIGFIPNVDKPLRLAKSFSLEKAFNHKDKGWLPESGDPDGLPKKDDESKIKHTSKVLGPVWKFNDRHSKIRDQDFASHYGDVQRNTKFSTQGKKYIQSLAKQTLKDEDRHVVASQLPNGDQALRLRHLQNAMLGDGGSMTEVNDGIVLTSGERHSKIKRTDNSPDSWHFGENGLKYLGKTPISKSNNKEIGNENILGRQNPGRKTGNPPETMEKSGMCVSDARVSGESPRPNESVGSTEGRGLPTRRIPGDRLIYEQSVGSGDGLHLFGLGQAQDNRGAERTNRSGLPIQSVSLQRNRLNKSKLSKAYIADNFSMQGKGFVDPASEHIDTLTQNGHKIHVLNSPDPRHTHYAITASGNPHDTPIAHSTVSTVDENDDPKEPFISHTYVDKPHREKGLATSLKLAIVNHLGSVNSDTRLSPASHRGWEKLTQNPELKVKISDQDDPMSSKPRTQHSISLKKPKI